MNCASCGRENRDDAVFCDQCGSKLLRQCSHCQRALAPDARFCDSCGTQVEASDPAEQPARDLRAYTPHYLADKILNQRSALEGEHKQVTVLFVDIQSSLQLTEGLDSERWHQILDRFFQILADGVHRFEGTVNQYTGDGIMALFGAPIAHEDHAQRACYATLHLSREIRRYTQKLRREEGLDIAVRMGLNSGEVVVGRIGDDLRMDYTAQGHTVGLASRMEGLAESGKVYLTQATAALVSGYFELEDLGTFRVQGHSEPIQVFALEKAGPLRTRLEVARSRGFSAFVGREEELAILDEALESTATRGVQGIGISAEPGVGKSRLCYEFAERCHSRGIDINWGQGVSHGRSVPYLPVRKSLREAFQIAEEEDSQRARQKVAGALLLADREIANDLPLIFDFLGISSPDDPAPLVEGEGRERRLFTIVLRYIEAAAQRQALVMILEDLQWYDSASQSFVQNLLARLSDSNVLMIFNYRPEYRPPWLDAANFREIRLDPLGEAAVSNLLQSLLGKSPDLGALSRRILETARGNPFFVEEVVQSLVDSGALSGSRGDYQLVRSPGELAIPLTVQALLAARVDRLPPRDKEILETAAVIGKTFSEQVLARVTRLSEQDLAGSLRNLIDSEFLREETLYPERVLMFKHPLMQEVAYQSQLSGPRAALHSEVARAHEDVLEDSLDENAALIAHHWEQSGNSLAAARWVHRAARWLTQSHPGEAMDLWRKLLRLLDESPSTAEIAFVRARACRWMLWLGASQGMPLDEASRLFEQGRASSEKTRDRRSLAITLANYGYYQSQIPVNPVLSLQLIEQAREIADASPNPWLKLTIDIRRTQALTFAGRFSEAVELGFELLERIADGTAPEIDPLDHVTLHSIVGDALTELGRPRDGIQITSDGLDLASQLDLTLNAGHCHITLVRCLAALGRGSQADTHAAAAMRAAERTGNTAMLVFAHDATSLAHFVNKRPVAAVASSLEALELSRERQVGRISESLHLAHLSLAQLMSGDAESAEESGERAVEAVERCGPRFAPRAYLALARTLRKRVGLEERNRIEALFQAVDDCIATTDAVLYRPILDEERGELLLLGDDVSGAEGLLKSALAGFESLGAETPARRVRSLLGALPETRKGSVL